MRYIILLLLILSLSGCKSDNDKILLKQIEKHLIDTRSIDSKYVIVYKLYESKIGEVYMITPGHAPAFAFTGEWPSKIQKYKDKYICLIDPTNEKILPEDFIRTYTSYNLSLEYDIPIVDSYEMWFVGISKDGKQTDVVRGDYEKGYFSICIYPSLFKYLFSQYNKTEIQFMASNYEWVVDDSYEIGASLNKHLLQMDLGEVFPIYSSKSIRDGSGFFATINGVDTLRYEITDTLNHRYFIKSIPNINFYKHLPETNTWEYLQGLLSDSTYYFYKGNEMYGRIWVPYCNSAPWEFINNELGLVVDIFYKEGISKRIRNKIDSSLHIRQ